MAYDPDLQPYINQIAALETRVTALENTAPGPGPNRDLPFVLYGPQHDSPEINATMRDMWLNYNGGWIIWDGQSRPIQISEPVVMQPGVQLWGTGMPLMYRDSRTRIVPNYSNDPVFLIDDGKAAGKRDAWGSSQLWNFQVDSNTPGLALIKMTGGNGSDIRNIMQAKGQHPLEHGVLIDGGRIDSGDGQYTIYDRVRVTRSKHGFTARKGAPDSRIRDSMFYCGNIRGSTGVWLQKGSGTGYEGASRPNNFEFQSVDVQFVDQGWIIDSREIEVMNGSWENRHGDAPWAQSVIKLGPDARDVTFRNYSIANLSSLVDRTVFDIDPNAQEYVFEYLTGHVKPRDVPPGLDTHFRWLP